MQGSPISLLYTPQKDGQLEVQRSALWGWTSMRGLRSCLGPYQQAVRYAGREGKWEEKGEEREGREGSTTQTWQLDTIYHEWSMSGGSHLTVGYRRKLCTPLLLLQGLKWIYQIFRYSLVSVLFIFKPTNEYLCRQLKCGRHTWLLDQSVRENTRWHLPVALPRTFKPDQMMLRTHSRAGFGVEILPPPLVLDHLHTFTLCCS